MTTMSKTRREALDQVEQHQQTLAHWEAERAAAEAELASLQDRAGEEVVADPAASDRLSADLQRLRDRLDIATRAVAAVAPKLHQARVAALEAEAVEWDREAMRRATQLQKHNARTAELLAELEKHEGRFVPAELALFLAGDALISGEPRLENVPAARSRSLQAEVKQAERSAAILRMVAKGGNPRSYQETTNEVVEADGWHFTRLPVEDFPESVRGERPVLPAPQFRYEAESA